jgi:hypothetical protein
MHMIIKNLLSLGSITFEFGGSVLHLEGSQLAGQIPQLARGGIGEIACACSSHDGQARAVGVLR